MATDVAIGWSRRHPRARDFQGIRAAREMLSGASVMKRVISPAIFLSAQMFAGSELGMMAVVERASRERRQADKARAQSERTVH